MEVELQQQRLAAISGGGRTKRLRARDQEPKRMEATPTTSGSTSATVIATPTQLDIPAELALVLQALTSKFGVHIQYSICINTGTSSLFCLQSGRIQMSRKDSWE